MIYVLQCKSIFIDENPSMTFKPSKSSHAKGTVAGICVQTFMKSNFARLLLHFSRSKSHPALAHQVALCINRIRAEHQQAVFNACGRKA